MSSSTVRQFLRYRTCQCGETFIQRVAYVQGNILQVDFTYKEMVIAQPVFVCPRCNYPAFAEKPAEIDSVGWHEFYAPCVTRFTYEGTPQQRCIAIVIESGEFEWKQQSR